MSVELARLAAIQLTWASAAPSVLAAFLASTVEFVEALTVVLAVGSVRGWRDALAGAGAALVVLLALVATLGSALARVPLHAVQLLVGTLLLLFGLRWLRKAILRAAGRIPLHDEQAAFARHADSMRSLARSAAWDRVAFFACFQITMMEGAEVVFIVLAVAAGGAGLMLPASLGALAALLVVVAVGFAVHRPLARVPENTLKFLVGVLLSAFGSFWTGEGMGILWPGGDWVVLPLCLAYLVVATVAVALCRRPTLAPDF
jgi:uncharacterized membrane protein